jgi:hypothetical protein
MHACLGKKNKRLIDVRSADVLHDIVSVVITGWGSVCDVIIKRTAPLLSSIYVSLANVVV